MSPENENSVQKDAVTIKRLMVRLFRLNSWQQKLKDTGESYEQSLVDQLLDDYAKRRESIIRELGERKNEAEQFIASQEQLQEQVRKTLALLRLQEQELDIRKAVGEFSEKEHVALREKIEVQRTVLQEELNLLPQLSSLCRQVLNIPEASVKEPANEIVQASDEKIEDVDSVFEDVVVAKLDSEIQESEVEPIKDNPEDDKDLLFAEEPVLLDDIVAEQPVEDEQVYDDESPEEQQPDDQEAEEESEEPEVVDQFEEDEELIEETDSTVGYTEVGPAEQEALLDENPDNEQIKQPEPIVLEDIVLPDSQAQPEEPEEDMDIVAEQDDPIVDADVPEPGLENQGIEEVPEEHDEQGELVLNDDLLELEEEPELEDTQPEARALTELNEKSADDWDDLDGDFFNDCPPAMPMLVRSDGTEEQKLIDLLDKPIIVGSGHGCDVQIKDPSIGAKHLRIYLDGLDYHFKDLGAKNGTFHNGKRSKKALLGHMDVLKIGEVHLRVKLH